jgi:phosphoserine phosphatase
MQPDNLNVFDLDGTLINANSFREISKNFAFVLCRKFRIASLFELVVWYLARKLNIISHLQFKQRVVNIFEKALTEEEKQHICQAVFDNYVNRAVFERMLSSDNCILCTACPFGYVSRMYFQKNVVLIASLDSRKKFPDPANFGTGKIENIRAYFKGRNIRVTNFYTDSEEDQPLIDFSMNAFICKQGHLIKLRGPNK